MKGETRTNLKVYDRSKSEITEFNENGTFVSDENLERFDNLLERALDDIEVLVLSGSIPPGIDSDIYKKYIEKSQGEEHKVHS